MLNIDPSFTVSTHAPGMAGSRLTQYRVKAAAVALEAGIAAVHDDYAAILRAAGAMDRPSVEALRAGKAGNDRIWRWRASGASPAPALCRPFESELHGILRRGLAHPEALLHAHGYRRVGQRQ